MEKVSLGRVGKASITRSATSPGTSSTMTRDPCMLFPPGGGCEVWSSMPRGGESLGLRGRSGRYGMGFGAKRFEQRVERLGERRHALVLEGPGDVGQGDTEVGERIDDRPGTGEIGVDGA